MRAVRAREHGLDRHACRSRTPMDLLFEGDAERGPSKYANMSLEDLLGGAASPKTATGGASPTLEQLLAASPRRVARVTMDPRSPRTPRGAELREALASATPTMKAKLMKKVWARVASPGADTLGREQVRSLLLQMGREESELDMDQAMKELDSDNDGSVDFKEFEV